MSRVPLLAAALAAAFPAAAADPPAAKRHALLAGVNRYKHPNLAPLKYAEADVADLKEVLDKAGYEAVLLTGDRATKADIEKVVNRVRTVGPGDTVVVALAGHGLQFEGDKESYFCPADAVPTDKRSLVSIAGVYAALDASFAGAKLVLVDACRDDPAAGRGVTAGASPPPPRGVGVLLSCSAGERAFEHDSLGHGVFFHHVLEGLKGKAKDADGEVTFDGLAGYVRRQVARDVPRLVKNGAKQSPNLKGDLSGTPPVLIPKRDGEHRVVEGPGGVVGPGGQGRPAPNGPDGKAPGGRPRRPGDGPGPDRPPAPAAPANTEVKARKDGGAVRMTQRFSVELEADENGAKVPVPGQRITACLQVKDGPLMPLPNPAVTDRFGVAKFHIPFADWPSKSGVVFKFDGAAGFQPSQSTKIPVKK